ncbi:glycosyltransferase family 61 protein [Halobellus salinus]|nr:glycosyltransferase family 61 protein [Halobellus salinus]
MIKKDGLRDTFKALLDQIEPTQEYDYAVSLASFNVENYYHWVIEHLPQLRGVEHYTAQEGVSPVLILPQNPPNWMIESLAVCGYDKDDWVEWTGEPTQVNHLIVPEHPFRSMEIYFPPAIENCRWLRDRTTSNVDTKVLDNINVSPYLYISREDANSRRVLNRDEILAELRPLGFQSYVLSDLSFRQQVALFSQAEIIVAPHGAGATNMVFATGAVFVELIHSGNTRGAHYFLLAQECGHEYIGILCEPVETDMKMNIGDLIDIPIFN